MTVADIPIPPVPPVTDDAHLTPSEYVLARYQVDLHDWATGDPDVGINKTARMVYSIAQLALHTHRERQSVTTLLRSALGTGRTAEAAGFMGALIKLEGEHGGLLAALDLVIQPFLPRA